MLCCEVVNIFYFFGSNWTDCLDEPSYVYCIFPPVKWGCCCSCNPAFLFLSSLWWHTRSHQSGCLVFQLCTHHTLILIPWYTELFVLGGKRSGIKCALSFKWALLQCTYCWMSDIRRVDGKMFLRIHFILQKGSKIFFSGLIKPHIKNFSLFSLGEIL